VRISLDMDLNVVISSLLAPTLSEGDEEQLTVGQTLYNRGSIGLISSQLGVSRERVLNATHISNVFTLSAVLVP
jgi:NACalpha-BTF3-like transcription factor